MKISSVLILVFSFCANIISAQNQIGFEYGYDYKYKLNLNYSNNLGSSIDNKFLYSIYQSKFLDDDLINNTLNNLNEKSNLIGNESNYGISFLEKQKSRFYLGFGFENVVNQAASFSSDLFKLAFKGNKEFESSYADLSSLSFSKFKFKKFNLNFGFKIGENSFLFLKPSFIQLNDYQNLSSDNLSLYTDSAALFLKLKGELNYTKSISEALTGAALDITYNYNTEKHYFELKLKDAGFVNNLKTKEYIFKEEFTWEGFEASSIFNLEDELIIQDSISNLIETYKNNNSETLMLPMFFSLKYNYKINNKLDLGFYSNYRLNTLNKLLIQLNVFHHMGDKLHLNYLISYGGYNSMVGGLNFLYSLNDKFLISVGSRYFSSAFNVSKSGGIGGNFNLIYQIK